MVRPKSRSRPRAGQKRMAEDARWALRMSRRQAAEERQRAGRQAAKGEGGISVRSPQNGVACTNAYIIGMDGALTKDARLIERPGLARMGSVRRGAGTASRATEVSSTSFPHFFIPQTPVL